MKPCAECGRHVREERCPFCGAAARLAVRPAQRASVALSRAALVGAIGATTLASTAACDVVERWFGKEPAPSPPGPIAAAYGGPPAPVYGIPPAPPLPPLPADAAVPPKAPDAGGLRPDAGSADAGKRDR